MAFLLAIGPIVGHSIVVDSTSPFSLITYLPICLSAVCKVSLTSHLSLPLSVYPCDALLRFQLEVCVIVVDAGVVFHEC